VASGAVRTEADAVVGPAHVGLVFGMAVHRSQFLGAVGKLALFAVLADAVLLVGAAHLCLVARAVLGVGGGGGRLGLETGAGMETQRVVAISWQKRISGRTGGGTEPRLAWLVFIQFGVNTNPQTLETVLLDLSNHFDK